MSDDEARAVDRIIGPGSASGLALAEVERRRASGEHDLVLFYTGSSVLIVPRSHIQEAA